MPDEHEELHECSGCKQEIDPDWCWCGSALSDHGGYDGHPFVPMGCICLYRREL